MADEKKDEVKKPEIPPAGPSTPIARSPGSTTRGTARTRLAEPVPVPGQRI